MASGEDIYNIGLPHIGEEYRNVLVPKNKSDWHGPWDCAEFASWCVYQASGILYGCTNNKSNPMIAEAYTGAWKRDVNSLGKKISLKEAARTIGSFALRYPPAPGKMGHIVISDGKGGTIEANSPSTGVIKSTLNGRNWHACILVPGIQYTINQNVVLIAKPDIIYKYRKPMMIDKKIKDIQKALMEKGFDPIGIDGKFGKDTQAAVIAFQSFAGLVIDGEVGSDTLKALGLN